jgi:hypothetical protein
VDPGPVNRHEDDEGIWILNKHAAADRQAHYYVAHGLPCLQPLTAINEVMRILKDQRTPAATPPLVDQAKAAKADTVVRGVLAPVRTPEQGGWPTYTLTVAACYKAPPDRSVKAGQTITVKTIKEIKGTATFYLVWDDRQGLYRLAEPYGDGGFSD